MVELLESLDELMLLLEAKLSKVERDKLQLGDFVFPEKRAWPIHDEKHAKIALVWATWPQHASVKSKVITAVLKKYPHLKGFGAAKDKETAKVAA